RRIGHASHRSHICAKLEIVQIHAAENDALSCGSRKQAHCGEFPGVQADSFELDRARDGLLVHRKSSLAIDSPNFFNWTINNIQTQRGLKPCTFVHMCCFLAADCGDVSLCPHFPVSSEWKMGTQGDVPIFRAIRGYNLQRC